MKLGPPFMLLLAASCVGCHSRQGGPKTDPDPALIDPWETVETPPRIERPKPPFDLPAPPEPPNKVGRFDLGGLSVDKLTEVFEGALNARELDLAIAAGTWVAKRGERPHHALAQAYALKGAPDAVFYWLQRFGLEVSGKEDLSKNRYFDAVRSDPRFADIDHFLRQCALYWRASRRTSTLVFLPKQFNKSEKTPVLVCMAADGWFPESFPAADSQATADVTGLPVICVSATWPLGPRTYEWAFGKPDAQRLKAALAEVADRVTVAPGKIILFGLTEGGQAALELAARAPERYAGAIAITPGHGSGFVSSPPLPRLDDRRFVLVVGSNELRVTDHWAGLARDWLEGNGAQVWYDRVPAKRHQLPDDFVPRIKTWVTHILTGAK
jgi:hypothetical protein